MGLFGRAKADRSDEEIAAVAIRKVFPDANVEKIPEADRSLDLAVGFPERGGTNGALVEVTMHTDKKQRELERARKKQRFKGLQKDWTIQFFDIRGVGSYDAAPVLPVKEIPPMVVGALMQGREGRH